MSYPVTGPSSLPEPPKSTILKSLYIFTSLLHYWTQGCSPRRSETQGSDRMARAGGTGPVGSQPVVSVPETRFCLGNGWATVPSQEQFLKGCSGVRERPQRSPSSGRGTK